MIFRLENDGFDWSELLPSFLESAEENLAILSENLLNLEERAGDKELLEDIYRRAHNLKGSAYTIGFQDLGDLAHSMENILKAYFQGTRTPVPGDLDVLMGALDSVKALLGELKDNGWVADHGPEIQRLMEKFEALQKEPGPTKKAEEKSRPPEQEEKAKTKVAVSREKKSPTGKKLKKPEVAFDTVRVKTVYLEKIMNLLGELVILRNTQADDFRRFKDFKKNVENTLNQVEVFEDQIFRNLEATIPDGQKFQWQVLFGRLNELQEQMTDMFERSASNYERFSSLLDQLEQNVVNIRMVPFSMLFRPFQRTIHDLARQFGKEIRYVQEGGETQVDRSILEGLVDPLMHLIRNAIDHGLETVEERAASGKPEKGTLRVKAVQENGRILVVVEDDGRGMNAEKIKTAAVEKKIITPEQAETLDEKAAFNLIFESGFSTKKAANQISGRGVGMNVVKENLARLHGEISIESTIGKGTRFILSLPLTLLITRALLVRVQQFVYAIPTSYVKEVLFFRYEDLMFFSGRPVLTVGTETLPVLSAQEALVGLDFGYFDNKKGLFEGILVESQQTQVVLAVDQILEEHGIVAKSLGSHIKHISRVSGSTVLPNGDLGLILDIPAILRETHDLRLRSSAQEIQTNKPFQEKPAAAENRHILLVEDELSVQHLEKSILEAAGYTVEVASNGEEALEKLSAEVPRLVVTDINMPRMDGFQLTERIRQDQRLAHLPVVVVSSQDTREDRQKGVAAGADAYLSKKEFTRGELLNVIKSLMS